MILKHRCFYSKTGEMNIVRFKMNIVYKNDKMFFSVLAFKVSYVTFEILSQLDVKFLLKHVL